MSSETLQVAKELTVAFIARMPLASIADRAADQVAAAFKTIYQAVKEAEQDQK